MGRSETLTPRLSPQGQAPLAPYVGLWTRLEGFQAEELADLITAREVVQASFMRERWPDRDPGDLSATVTVLLPLVQVPPRGVWGRTGQATFERAEAWLGRPLERRPSADALVLRYLGAFGPATVMDAQGWSGITRLGEVFERLRPQLVSFRAESGRELFDLPEAPRPDPETPAPVRFLPEYDNVLLGHADRARVMDAERRVPLRPGNGAAMGTVLVDGRFEALWRIVREDDRARLVVEPFGRLTKRAAAAVEREGMGLLAFAAQGAERADVDILAAP